MRTRAGLVAALALLASACAGLQPNHKAFVAGYQSTRITDANNRPIQLDIWFPAKGPAEAVHNYGISEGKIAAGAQISGQKLPIILLSHGSMGAAVNYSWIAEPLARHGYVVLGVSHFGESPAFGAATINPTTVAKFGDRTRDFKVALDYLLAQPAWAGHVDPQRIGLLGHSAGGATVMMLAGGKIVGADIAAYCRTEAAKGDKSCLYPAAAMADPKQAPEALGRPVRAIVAMDPALGQGVSKASLAAVTAPALLIGSAQNDFLPFAAHAGRYMEQLPQDERLVLDAGEGHFVYVDTCGVPTQAMGVPLCTDRPGVDRAKVHERLIQAIVAFFGKRL